MPDAFDNLILPEKEEEINAVAELMYHCGVATLMDYGPDGSGAFLSDAVIAFKEFFNYDSLNYS